MFSDLASSIYECIENERVPFVGGDFNSRLGDLNNFAHSIGLNWKYSQNMDSNTNSHSRLLRDLCNLCKVLPFNHLKFCNTQFPGHFTFFRNGKKSQIDFLLSNNVGRRCVTNYDIIYTHITLFMLIMDKA